MEVVLGLGSNRGDRLCYLRDAIHRLQNEFPIQEFAVTSISPLYESEALLPEGAPDSWNLPFLNVNLLCQSNLSPLELLDLIKKLENQIGRIKRGRWAPREIDIDILVMGDLVLKSESLQIPHAGLLERPFAILPLADLVPDWEIPVQTLASAQTLSSEASPARIRVKDFVGQLKRNWDSIPFQTRRSHLCIADLMGVLNITPDSFSDGGNYYKDGKTNDPSLRQIHQLIQSGIRILDIGGESTRPGASPVTTEEEWSRIGPLLQIIENERDASSLFADQDIRISIDTRNPEIAARALKLGANWINDVTGFASDSMKEVLAKSQVRAGVHPKLSKAVIMHSLSVPPQKGEALSADTDLIDQLLEWGENRIQSMIRFGIEKNRIIFDPGLGFGKTPSQSWEILRRAHEFHQLRVPILFGHSRKSFLSTLTSKPAHERDLETVILSVELVKKGIQYLRVHQGELNTRALKAWTLVDGVSRC